MKKTLFLCSFLLTIQACTPPGADVPLKDSVDYAQESCAEESHNLSRQEIAACEAGVIFGKNTIIESGFYSEEDGWNDISGDLANAAMYVAMDKCDAEFLDTNLLISCYLGLDLLVEEIDSAHNEDGVSATAHSAKTEAEKSNSNN